MRSSSMILAFEESASLSGPAFTNNRAIGITDSTVTTLVFFVLAAQAFFPPHPA